MKPNLGYPHLLLAGFALANMAMAAPTPVPAALEQALTRGDWARVAALCPAAQQLADAPVLRALKGHACLALNRNNESFGAFASIGNPESVRAWSEWTQGLVAREPASPVAWYLRGDAMSRSGDWKGAVTAGSKALALAPAQDGKIQALALNARGVACAYLGEHFEAKRNFDAAIAADPLLADPSLNCGTLLIVKEAGEGALLYLEQAVGKSPKFGLAHNARGCARLGVSRDAESLTRALADFIVAAGVAETKALAEANIAALKRRFTGDGGKENASLPGTTLTARDFFDLEVTKGPEAAKTAFDRLSSSNQDKLKADFSWNKTWSGASELLSGKLFGVDIGPGPSGDRDRWASLEVMADDKYTKPGGGDTAKTRLENSSGDMGPWPAKTTRFGLFAGTELPTNP